MNEKGTVTNYYKKLSKTYDKKRLGTEKNKVISKFQNAWFVKNLGNKETSVCLEIGCGTGRLTTKLLKNIDILVATDTSPEMIDLNLRKTSSYTSKKEIHHVVCDATHLPFRDGVFNNVVSARVFWHITDYRQVIKEALRMLVSGGSLLFDFPCLLGPFSIYSRLHRVNHEVLTLFVSERSLKRLFSKSKNLIINGNSSIFLVFMPDFLLKIKTIMNLIRSLEFSNNFFLKNTLYSYYLIKFTK